MPEGRELECMYRQLKQWFDSMVAIPGWKPVLRDFFLDVTKAERKRYRSKRLKKGYIDRISCAMTAERGSQHIQTRLFPWMFPSLPALLDEELELTGIERTGRSIILVFGKIICQVQPLTHTSVQVYDEENWKAVFATSHLPLIKEYSETKMRPFKVGMALQIGDHVVSFNTSDFIFQVTWVWARDRNDPVRGLPHRDFNVLDQWELFVASWAELLEASVTSDTQEGDFNVRLRDWLTEPANTMYNPGVGAYSVTEVMHLAGLSIDLTLGDFLRSPSRICRYLLALYQFLYDGRHRVWPELVRACIVNNLLGGTIEQRMRYPHYLRVWAKNTFWTSERHYEAILSYNSADANSPGECDAVEPTAMRDAMRHAPELVPVVFGELGNLQWEELSDAKPWLGNPLLHAFQRMAAAGVLSLETSKLDASRFESLFLTSEDMRTRSIRTSAYRKPDSYTVWSVFTCKRDAIFELLEGDMRTRKLFRVEVLGSRDVAIGPLEYRGAMMVVKIASSDEHYRYPARGAVLQDKIPYSVALNAVTQDIVHVKAFRDAMAGNGKARLSNAEKSIRERARTAFQMQHPVDWTQAKAEMSIASAASGSRATEKPRRRTQAEITMDESPSVEGGRGMRSRSSLAPDAYNRKRHMVDEHLKEQYKKKKR